MARETPCQTPESLFQIHIHDRFVECRVVLPFKLTLNEEEATLLEANVNNAMELVLAPYFKRRR